MNGEGTDPQTTQQTARTHVHWFRYAKYESIYDTFWHLVLRCGLVRRETLSPRVQSPNPTGLGGKWSYLRKSTSTILERCDKLRDTYTAIPEIQGFVYRLRPA